MGETGDRGWDLQPILDWLLDEGRFLVNGDEFTGQLGARLVAAGAPIMRFRLSARVLHPLFAGWTAVWEKSGVLAQESAPHGLDQRPAFIGSPMAIAQESGKPFRRRLENGLDPSDHQVLHEIRGKGATDYLAVPMQFYRGRGAIVTVACDRPGGFSDDDLTKLESLARAMAPVVEVAYAHHLASSVASAYIGPRSGARVLDGRIRRGDIETMRAAIWFSDLRGWSRLANEMPAAEAVALANDYFELVDAAITDAGGEVLKLIGDAVLAIFPIETDEQAACQGALNAATDACRTARKTDVRFEFGIGLHLGELVYGNVGSPTRLDFTVMGQAVNLAARIEKLSRTVNRPVILSEPFAAACGAPAEDLGAHPVAGWAEPVRVFSPT